MDQTELKYPPVDIQYARQKGDPKSRNKSDGSADGGGGEAKSGGAGSQESTISINMSGRSLLLYNTADPSNPVELAFQQR